MPNYTKVTGPKSRPRHANPNHPMNREQTAMPRREVTPPTPRPKRPAKARQVYTGQTGMYSTD
ncbi:hypothetical protein FAMCQIZV_CDS0021 [Phage C72C1]|nr:hypothetical protein FAMCQIZV_CDS0021 [Phage C72C1]